MVAMEELEMLVENVEELVMDENRIVTYKLLSLSLNIHVNQAKRLLYYYVERKRKENSGAQLNVTYLVSGKAVEDGILCHKVAVVREDQLAAMKQNMVVIVSVHVYSIQRAMLKDSSPLFNTDYEAIKENLLSSNKYSAIQCVDAVPRSTEEMARLQKSLQQTSRSSSEPPSTGKAIVNGSAPVTAKSTAPQPKGIMGMFSAKSSTKSCNKEEGTEPVVVKDGETAAPSGSKMMNKGKSFSNFFQKVSAKKGSPPSKSAKEEAPLGKPALEPTEKVDAPEVGGCPIAASQGGDDEEMVPRNDTVTHKAQAEASQEKIRAKEAGGRAQQGDGQSKKAKRSVAPNSDREVPPTKRRRRIRLPQSDSSNEEVMASSPEVCDVKTPSPIAEGDVSSLCFSEVAVKPQCWESTDQAEAVGVKRRKRRRVLKNNTFLNDEGEFVTEKVYQSESCTDSENEFAAKPQLKKTSDAKSTGTAKDEHKGQKEKKAGVPIRGGKQASIMGFFKKTP
ncbi:DNA polymerase delta subunit 3 isoform X2 [Narcine bancroftii]|uniref:DNA polymerase delta subunit 3 isoform X2 n=1 Tax=Narcine bancroftii TaxID=1343680 RepID=UPI003831093D